jgi:prephenate dehydrogenase
VVAADEHDRAMAFLSHMPQVVAWAIAEAARRDPVAARHRELAGTGFRDMTRLAHSPRGLWRQILGQNRRAIAAAMRVLRAELRRLERSPPRGRT